MFALKVILFLNLDMNKVWFYGPSIKAWDGTMRVGGGTVLCEELRQTFDHRYYVNTNVSSNYLLSVCGAVSWLLHLVLRDRTDKVVALLAHRQALLLFLGSFMRKRKIHLRLIGGNFDYYYANKFVKKFLGYTSRKVIIYVELEKDMQFFRGLGFRAIIHENVRSRNKVRLVRERSKNLRVGFLGRINRSKGIDVFLELADKMKENQFIICGPVDDNAFAHLKYVDPSKNYEYIGELDWDKLDSFFDSIDVLFFHSAHEGEGKPGVLIEALIRHLPSITNYMVDDTKWKDFYDRNYLLICDGKVQSYEMLMLALSDEGLSTFKGLEIFDIESLKKLVDIV